MSNIDRSNNKSKQIIFYDGFCKICSWAVDFIMPRDKDNKFLFAPLSGKTAQINLSPKLTENPFTIVLFDPNTNQTYIKSDAALRIAEKLSFPWKFFSIFLFLPKIFRDFLYMIVSKFRYSILDKRSTCRLPTEQEKSKFLD